MCLLRYVSGEDGGLDSGTVGNGLIWVDALVGLLAIEEVRNELGNTGNMSETTDEYDLMQVGLVDL